MGKTKMRRFICKEEAPETKYPKCRVVSMRINDEEWEELFRISSSTGKTISQYLREVLLLGDSQINPREASREPRGKVCAGTVICIQDIRNLTQ